MKFEIEIPENTIKRVVNDFVFLHSNQNLSYAMESLLREEIKLVLAGQLNNEIKLVITDKIKGKIEEEAERVVAKKLPGWVNQRVKEMLNSVRMEFAPKGEK